MRVQHLHYFAARDLADAVARARASLAAYEAAELDRREAARPFPDGGHIPHRPRVTERHCVDPFPLDGPDEGVST